MKTRADRLWRRLVGESAWQLAIAVVAVLTVVAAVGDSVFASYVLDACLLACIGAIGLNLLMGTAGQASIGTAAFLAVGGFVAAGLQRAGVAFPIAIVAAGAGAGIAGFLAGLPSLRLRGLYLALSTIATYYIVMFLADQYQAHTVGSLGFVLPPLFGGNSIIWQERYWALLLGIITIITICVVAVVSGGKTGRALRMIRDHDIAAAAIGISARRYKLGAFAFSSFVIGIAGGLAAYFVGSVSTDNYPFNLSVQYIAMILLGGVDSILGAVIGAAVVSCLPSVLPLVLDSLVGQSATTYGSEVAEILYGVIVIVFITRAPGGLVGLLSRRPSKQLARKLLEPPPAAVGTEAKSTR